MAVRQKANIPLSGMARQEVRCDTCGCSFGVDLHEKPIPGGGVRQYLECPDCNTRYPVSEITDTGLRIRRRLYRLAQLGQMRTPQYRTLLDRYKTEVIRLASQEQSDDRSPVS